MTIENLEIKLTETDMAALRRIRKKLSACKQEVDLRDNVDRFMALDKGETIFFEVLMAGYNYHEAEFHRQHPEFATKLDKVGL